MASQPAIRGTIVQGDTPRWFALEAAVGPELSSWFMWMCEVRLNDGRRMDAYKHIATRRYLHLAAGGAALRATGDAGYRDIELSVAITTAFAGWQSACPVLRDVRALDGAVAFARRFTP